MNLSLPRVSDRRQRANKVCSSRHFSVAERAAVAQYLDRTSRLDFLELIEPI